jgi:spoIIIJ-associated protein
MATKKQQTEDKEVKRLPFAKEEKVISEVVSDLLQALSITDTFEVQEREDGVELLLDSQDNGILIGYHGEVLEALQLILSMAISKKLGYFLRMSIEIGEYKKNRSSYLENMAYDAKQRALTEGREISLPNLKSWERRIVHMLFQNDEEVVSESVGEGRERTLVIKPK